MLNLKPYLKYWKVITACLGIFLLDYAENQAEN